MKRRSFLKSIPAFPLWINSFYAGDLSRACPAAPARRGQTDPERNNHQYFQQSPARFALLKVRGSYYDIGYTIGRVFSKNIRQIILRRDKWHKNLLDILDTENGKTISSALNSQTKKSFPHLLNEVRGMADGAGVHLDAIWGMCIKSELLAVEKEPTGCSTIVYKKDNNFWLFQNEDGHSAYRDIMFLLEVEPPTGVRFASMVYPGIITGNGPSLNDRGVVQCTNYISSRESEPGIPRYFIGRAILEAKNLKEAIDIAAARPRAYPYHHNLISLSEKKYVSVESTPQAVNIYKPEGEIYFHTNHLLFIDKPNNLKQNSEYVNSSSLSRFQAIDEQVKRLSNTTVLPEDLLSILSSHQNVPYSPCRHPEGNVQGQTLGTVFVDINKGLFRLFKNNPCVAVKQNQFHDFSF